MAYRNIDLVENQMIESEVETLLNKGNDTNDNIQHIYSVLSLIKYNRMAIIANIKSGMKTNWNDILTKVIFQYNHAFRTFEKSMSNRYSSSNSFNTNNLFLQTCFTMSDCETIITYDVETIQKTYLEYESAKKDSLASSNILPEMINDILLY